MVGRRLGAQVTITYFCYLLTENNDLNRLECPKSKQNTDQKSNPTWGAAQRRPRRLLVAAHKEKHLSCPRLRFSQKRCLWMWKLKPYSAANWASRQVNHPSSHLILQSQGFSAWELSLPSGEKSGLSWVPHPPAATFSMPRGAIYGRDNPFSLFLIRFGISVFYVCQAGEFSLMEETQKGPFYVLPNLDKAPMNRNHIIYKPLHYIYIACSYIWNFCMSKYSKPQKWW